MSAGADPRRVDQAAGTGSGSWTPADGTSQGAVESALRVSEARFRAMFEDSPIGTSLVDLEGRYVAVNAALQILLGYRADELIGHFEWEQYPDKSSATPMAHLEKLLSGATESYRREQRYLRSDGEEIFAQVTAALLRDGDGNAELGLCMVEDITERKQLEGRLRQAQKMEAVGQFAGGIAHDFNNTLSTITAYAQILFDDLVESDERRADAAEILKAASRAAGLTRQLLTFSRKKVLDYELLDVCAVVDDFEALLRPLIPASIELVTNVAREGVIVRADRTQLEQVLMNLALNARDAMPSGGTLKIEVAKRVIDSAAGNDGEQGAGGFALLTISDGGVGISDEVRARLFEPFFTTKSDGRGTGLGLATVYAIVRQSGGTVTVDSRPGQGSRFAVTLPLASGPAPVDAPQNQTSSPKRESRTTILLAEDESSVREAARRLLHRAGMHVLTACNGVEALDILNQGEHVDVLMTDMMMPVMGGIELIGRASMLYPELRIIVISGYADVRESDPRTLGDVVLEKPFTADSLIRAVQSLTAGTPRAAGSGVK